MPLPQRTPYAAAAAGPAGARLIFATGAEYIRLRGDPALDGLYRASPGAPAQHSPDEVVVLRGPRADICLNGSVAWTMEFRGGIGRLEADLRAVRLKALDVLGGVSDLTLRLPAPEAATFIYLAGGVERAIISRPPGTGLRVCLRAGATQVRLDGRHLSAVPGDTTWESAGFNAAAGHYDLVIAGGVTQLMISQAP